jgi:hypothetical protein
MSGMRITLPLNYYSSVNAYMVKKLLNTIILEGPLPQGDIERMIYSLKYWAKITLHNILNARRYFFAFCNYQIAKLLIILSFIIKKTH